MTKRHVALAAMAAGGLMLAMSPGALAKTKTADAEMTETDTFAMEWATGACAAGDLPGLVRAMAISEAVARKYSADTVAVIRDGTMTKVARDDYAAFPIGMLDYTWVTRDSMLAWETDPAAEQVTLAMEFNQGQTEAWAVDWQAVRYDGASAEGEEMGQVVETLGPPGTLLFYPTADCFELVEDFVVAE